MKANSVQGATFIQQDFNMTTKLRLFRRCLEAFQDYKSENRNKDLVVMSRKWDTYKKELRTLIVALQDQHDASSKMNRARMKVSTYLITPMEFSPLQS